MPNFNSDSKPKLWMITNIPEETLSKGEKWGAGFAGGVMDFDDEPSEESSQKSNNDSETGLVSVPVRKLQENLQGFMETVGDLFIQAEQKGATQQKPGMQLDQIEVYVGVNAEGEVGFWGLTKGKVRGVTEIKLTFKRQG